MKTIKLEDLSNGKVRIEGVDWCDIACACYGLERKYTGGEMAMQQFNLIGRPEITHTVMSNWIYNDPKFLKTVRDELLKLHEHKRLYDALKRLEADKV